MTDAPLSLEDAVDDHDVTLAFSPGQLVLVVIGVYVLVRTIRKLRA